MYCSKWHDDIIPLWPTWDPQLLTPSSPDIHLLTLSWPDDPGSPGIDNPPELTVTKWVVLMLCHSGYVVHVASSHHIGMLLPYIITRRRVSTVHNKILWERERETHASRDRERLYSCNFYCSILLLFYFIINYCC